MKNGRNPRTGLKSSATYRELKDKIKKSNALLSTANKEKEDLKTELYNTRNRSVSKDILKNEWLITKIGFWLKDKPLLKQILYAALTLLTTLGGLWKSIELAIPAIESMF